MSRIEIAQDFYRLDLIQLAEQIMDAKSNADDAKAFSDMMLVCKILTGEINGFINLAEVDQRLRQEYPTIENLEYVASQCPARTYSSGKIYDELTVRLYADARGICADVLLKHGKIAVLKELIVANAR